MKQKKGLATAIKQMRGKRDWVKNALIIFLAVLLVLTFFSNTIMNYSLPEVAAQYPMSTTITTKIRGSGTVEAAQTYNVIVEETRKVATVNVKEGDTVKAGDTLLTLEESESQELIDARAAYSALKLEYDKLLLDKGNQNNASEAALQQARDAVSNAESDLAAAREYEEDLAWYNQQVSNAQSTADSRATEKRNAELTVQSLEEQIQNVENSNAEYLAAKERGDDTGASAIYEAQIAPRIAELTRQKAAAQQALSDAEIAESNANAALASAQSALTQFQTENSGAMSVSAAEDALQAARDALTAAEAAAKDAAAQQTYDDAVAQLDLKAKEEELKRAEETLKALEDKASAAKIVSRHAGVVQSVSVAAGDTTAADTPLMVVELTEQGYTLSASVTKAQARMLREGLTAEITNLWDSGITMTLDSITADKNDPAGSRTLNFTVQGDDVTVGQQLSFSIGDKNASYDVVIPSSAIHADADGSFVYTVAVKSSPLGNRYTVKKTKVEVLAADDTNSAVTGELSTADFVITTATVPLQPGDQVRIAE